MNKHLFFIIFFIPAMVMHCNLYGQVNIKRKVDREVNYGIDKGIESIKKSANKESDAESEGQVMTEDNDLQTQEGSQEQLKAYSKYNFVPGDLVIFEDNLDNEENGEFPSKWDLKYGNVEIAVFGGENVINFPSTDRAEIVPLMKEKGDYLPEKFTVEFDAYFSEFCTKYTVYLYDMINQKNPNKLPDITVSPWDVFIDGAGSIKIENRKEDYPYWQRIAISFNIRSLKVYFGEQRIANIPNLPVDPTGITVSGKQCHDGEQSFIRNVRIATGSMKLYDKVVTDGKFTTNGIRFDVGKATIRPESMGVINEVYKLMSDHPDLSFRIEGHTDSDGDETANQKLSEERARAVMQLLVDLGIQSDRLDIAGFGESQPVDTNSTPEGKANNRRVEFIRL